MPRRISASRGSGGETDTSRRANGSSMPSPEVDGGPASALREGCVSGVRGVFGSVQGRRSSSGLRRLPGAPCGVRIPGLLLDGMCGLGREPRGDSIWVLES